MTKDEKITHIITTVVCLIPIAIALLNYGSMPEQLVTHWNAYGEPDGYSSKFFATIVLPGILAIINILFPFLLKIDPKYNNMSAKVKNMLHWIIPAVSIFASALTLGNALGYTIDIPFFSMLFLGFLFTFIGNYLPKMGQSYTVGIKLPWTLNDEDNWIRTHRFAGHVWVVCGILIIISAFFTFGYIFPIVLLTIMILSPIVYSYLLYVKKNKE